MATARRVALGLRAELDRAGLHAPGSPHAGQRGSRMTWARHRERRQPTYELIGEQSRGPVRDGLQPVASNAAPACAVEGSIADAPRTTSAPFFPAR